MNVTDRHGGDIYAAAHETGRSLTRILDFSASINPLGPSPRVSSAITAALPHAVSYPDSGCRSLCAALSERHSLRSHYLLAGNGSSELIHLLPRALGIRCALVLGPTFSEYERSLTIAGARVMRVLADRRDNYRPPWRQVAFVSKNSGSRIDAVYLCNPNSPTGQGVTPDEVIDVVRVLGRKGIWCVVDESFVEYARGYSVIEEIVRERRLIVLRSFTKFFAIPGLRLGYLAAQPVVVEYVKAIMPPWSANSLAQAAGIAALGDRRHIRRSLAFMATERARLVKRLGLIPGVVVFPSLANFLLVELPAGRSSRAVAAKLRERGMLIRDCSVVPGLSNRTIRIAVRNSRENDRLIAAISELIG